jgi:hypothetical protein
VGHLFVAHGDLTKLACDGVLIPCDSALNINQVWQDLLPRNLARSCHHPGWLTLGDPRDATGVVALPQVNGRSVSAFVAVEGAVENSPDLVIDRMWRALTGLAETIQPRGGRVKPLIGVPLVGTGHGGLEARRAEVIDELLRRHRSDPLVAADVALVLFDRRDFAAVQERRTASDWDLAEQHCVHADRLGKLAAQGELSLFLGAGISKPVGLPSWWELLDSLADSAGVGRPDRGANPFEAAVPIVEALGAGYHEAIRQLLVNHQHGVGHALLASIGPKRIVTTNFDGCMELALQAPTVGGFSVLTRELARGGLPWLLKLNGDIEAPSTIVLTDADLRRDPEERRALEGVVQGLLLTSHLFFVGFSLTDDNFLQLADAVSRVRARAQVGDPSLPGTALTLTMSERAQVRYSDLHLISMDPDSFPVGARLLEVFLDRMVWAAAIESDLASEYLLDERYESGMSAPDRALRDALGRLVEDATAEARTSIAWRRVANCLRALGADEDQLQ